MIIKNLYITGKEDEPKDIKIENGIISEIESPGFFDHSKNEVTLKFEDSIVFPGLINSHDHLEFNLYPQLGHNIYEDYVEWGKDIHAKDKEIINAIEGIPVDLRLKFGVIKNLLSGITTVVHHGESELLPVDTPVSILKDITNIHSVRLGSKWKLKLNWIKNLEPYVIHIGEGINKESADEINELINWNLFGRKIIGVHGIAMTELQSKNFNAIIWCPVSNLFLFNKTSDINSLKRNTKILFGTDSTLTSCVNIWNHLRKARELNLMTDVELFSSLTDKAAEVWGLKETGKISNKQKADLVITKKHSENLYESFFRNNPEDILLILKEGKIILYDESVKEQVLHLIIQRDNFNEVSVGGKIKFVNYPVDQVIIQLKEYIPGVTLPL